VTREDEERIARVERQLAATQQITHIGTWEWELATGAVKWSDELYRIYGLEPGSVEITFETFLARVHPDDRERTTREVRAALEAGGPFGYPERILRPDGSVRDLETKGAAMLDANGRVTGLFGTCRDVTAERKREETLTLFEDVVHNVQIGLIVLHVEDAADVGTARLISFNPAAETIARRELSDMLGKSLREIVPFAVGGKLEQLVLGVAADGVVREATVPRSRDPRDPNRAVSIKVFPLPASCVGVALDDVSEEMRSRRVREAEARTLEQIVAGEPLGAIMATLAEAVEQELPGAAAAIVLVEQGGAGARFGAVPAANPQDVASFAIRASDGRALGALELHPSAAPVPPGWQEELVARATRIAGIAIERRELEDQLRALSHHVESVREDERTGIAREIHDELGQGLTALKMDIAWLGRRAADNEPMGGQAIREHLRGMSQLADDIIQQVRRISAELRPGVLDDLGLGAAIEWQAQEFTRRTGTACAVHSNLGDVHLERPLSTGLFRIFQEALTNVARHARATNVEVRLVRDAEWIELSVRDDGVGIAPEALASRRSLGLLGIRERARNLGGTASVGPAGERGALLSVRVPCKERNPGDATGGRGGGR
jgi:PAS domain S-box-containing protein